MPEGPPPLPSRTIARRSLRLDVSEAVALPGRHEIALDWAAPARFERDDPACLLVCLPGGFLSRRYFDLALPDGDRRFSFAEAMARRGFAVAAFDHLGIGESTRPTDPEDGYRLGVDEVVRANQCALEQLLEALAKGEDGLPEMAGVTTVGVGHSLGSCLTVAQQALAAPHAALVLFSFTTAGLPAFLPPEHRPLAGDPAAARRAAADAVRQQFGTPYPGAADDAEPGTTAAFGVGTAPPEALTALQAASTHLLGVPGWLTLVPGAYAPYAERVEVPVFVACGDHDLHRPHGVALELPRAPEVVAYELPDCWHCHHVANSRERLWARTAHWILGATEA